MGPAPHPPLAPRLRWRPRGGAGFTLIESVTATGVFVLIVLAVVNTYLFYADLQRTSTRREKIVSEANFLLDQMAQEIRQHEIAYWGTLNYDNTIPAERLYEVDVADVATAYCDSVACCGYPASECFAWVTDIYLRERELVLFDDRDNADPSDDLVIAYVFNRRDDDTVVNLCRNESGALIYPGGTVGLFRFTQDGASNPVNCQRLFDVAGIAVENVGFWFTQPFNPYPDAVAPPTDRAATAGRTHNDCGPGSGANFNGYACTCTSANQATACFSASCETATGGRCGFGENRQPAVTVAITVRDTVTPLPALTFQTTVAQRLYKR